MPILSVYSKEQFDQACAERDARIAELEQERDRLETYWNQCLADCKNIAELEQRNRDLYEDVQRFKEHALNEKDARVLLERQLHEQAVSLAEAQKDAERYQWLRKTRFIWSDFRYISGVAPTGVGLEFGWFPSKNNRPSREDLDAAIDAAMKKEQT